MYIVKLPSGEYINLALVQRVEVGEDSLSALVHWSNGGKNIYHQEDVVAISRAISNNFLDFSNEQTT
jgi:aromatic ring-cleaving dioxygenase